MVLLSKTVRNLHHGASVNTAPCQWQRAASVHRGLTQDLTEQKSRERFLLSTGTCVVRSKIEFTDLRRTRARTDTKSLIPVPVVRVPVVAVGRPAVSGGVVPAAAADHAMSVSACPWDAAYREPRENVSIGQGFGEWAGRDGSAAGRLPDGCHLCDGSREFADGVTDGHTAQRSEKLIFGCSRGQFYLRDSDTRGYEGGSGQVASRGICF